MLWYTSLERQEINIMLLMGFGTCKQICAIFWITTASKRTKHFELIGNNTVFCLFFVEGVENKS